MVLAFENSKAAGADGLLGEGGQDPGSEEGAEGRGGEKGRECTSAMHNRPDAPVWGFSSDEGRRARSTHAPRAGACKESTHWRKRSFPAHAAQRAHSCHNEEEGKEASYPVLQ